MGGDYNVYPKLVLLGDSLTQWASLGFAGKLQDTYMRSCDVVNRGLSGFNTKMILAELNDGLSLGDEKADCLCLIIFLGTNDAVRKGCSQHVPLDDFKVNLGQIIKCSRERVRGDNVLLMTPPPADMAKASGERYDPEQTQRYASAVKEVGSDLEIPVADVWQAFMDRARDLPQRLSDLLKDGIHLTSTGNDLVAQVVQDTLRDAFPDAQKRLEKFVVSRTWRSWVESWGHKSES